jgi:ABC-2 type transport system ATP-binding protein
MTESVIDVQHLNKTFGTKHVVKDLSLSIAKGEIFGFLGPNGSGKTTSIRLLCGLLTPDSGTGKCLGYDIISESEQIKLNTGYMTQAFSMWKDLTVEENLDFVARMYLVENRKQAVQAILARFNLANRAHQLADSLSGGWKQRLALAACMLHEPKLLLLDEPTAGVDPKARRDFWEELHVLASQGITIMVSTHYMDEAERCHKLAYICDGTLMTHGTAEKIIKENAFYTYSVSGDNLSELSLALKNKPGVGQVIVFGTMLHVSGKNIELLEQTLDQLPKSYTIVKIPTSLEDIFIHLMDKQ